MGQCQSWHCHLHQVLGGAQGSRSPRVKGQIPQLGQVGPGNGGVYAVTGEHKVQQLLREHTRGLPLLRGHQETNTKRIKVSAKLDSSSTVIQVPFDSVFNE